MIIKYNADIKNETIENSFKRLIGQTYKLLPNWEENIEWRKPLETILIELSGMDRLLTDQELIFFPLLCKLEGLFTLNDEADFEKFRRTIFESLSLMNNLKDNICHQAQTI